MTSEQYDAMLPDIHRRASMIESDRTPSVQDEVRAAIAFRLVEMSSAIADNVDGTVAYLWDQRPDYVVQYAAGRVYSDLRRARREACRTLRIVDDDMTDGVHDIADNRPDTDPVALVEGFELTTRIANALSARDRVVYRMLIEGYDRTAIGSYLGIDRRRVHDCVVRIRKTAARVLVETETMDAPQSAAA